MTPSKPAHQRRRRNPPPGVTLLPPEGSGREAPPLPSKRPAWLPTTGAWWDAVWASPMAAQFILTDEFALARLAHLIDHAARGNATAALLREVRHLEDAFGLSPLGRHRLRWQIGDAPAADLRVLRPRRPDPRLSINEETVQP